MNEHVNEHSNKHLNKQSATKPVVAVIGAGVIGLSWAELFAEHAWEVRIFDPAPDAVPEDPRWTRVASIVDAVADADLVQENGPERLEVKRSILAEVAEAAGPATVIASSTSGILPSALASGLARASQLVVAHPYNPPRIMPLVEVVPGPDTAPEVVRRAVEMYRSVGRTPVALRKEVPGFVGNRVHLAVLDEAMWLHEQGVVGIEEFDEIIRGSFGLRWASTGVLEALHLGGGPGGIRHILTHLGGEMTAIPRFPPRRSPDEIARVIAETESAYGDASSYPDRVARRDRVTTAVRDAAIREDCAPQLYALGMFGRTLNRIDIRTGTVTVVADGLRDFPDGITVDADTAYITHMGAPDGPPPGPGLEPAFTARDGSIVAVDLRNGEQREVVPPGIFTTGKQITLDHRSGRLYWTDREGRAIWTSALDGTDRHLVVDTTGTGESPAHEHCVGIAVDPDGGQLYWTQKGPRRGGRGRILRAPLPSSPFAHPVAQERIEILWDGLPEPIDLYLDAEAAVLYWTDRGTPPRGNTLNRAALPSPGEQSAPPTILAGGFSEAIGVAFDTGTGLAYVADLSGAIREIDLARGTGRPLASINGGVTGLALVAAPVRSTPAPARTGE